MKEKTELRRDALMQDHIGFLGKYNSCRMDHSTRNENRGYDMYKYRYEIYFFVDVFIGDVISYKLYIVYLLFFIRFHCGSDMAV